MTQCTHCGKVLSTFTAAVRHVRGHPPIARKGRSVWGPGIYKDGERWDAYADRTDPPNRAQQGTKTGVDSAQTDGGTSGHSEGCDWRITPCLCDCHYPIGTMQALVSQPCNDKRC